MLRGREKANARSERASQTKKRERASSMVPGGVGTPRRECNDFYGPGNFPRGGLGGGFFAKTPNFRPNLLADWQKNAGR